MQNDLRLIDVFIVLIPVFASVYFFMCYAEHFPNPKETDSHEDLAMGKEATFIYLAFAATGISIAIPGGYLYALLNGISISNQNLIAAGMYAAMYFYYGLFLLRHPDATNFPIIRCSS